MERFKFIMGFIWYLIKPIVLDSYKLIGFIPAIWIGVWSYGLLEVEYRGESWGNAFIGFLVFIIGALVFVPIWLLIVAYIGDFWNYLCDKYDYYKFDFDSKNIKKTIDND